MSVIDGYRGCPIIIGNTATFIPEEERSIKDLSHKWTCYVRAPESIVKSVQFKLHESFVNPIMNTSYPFEISESGWGEFNIQIRITLFNDDKLATSHYLSLHGEENPTISEKIDCLIFKDKNVPEFDNSHIEIIGEDEEYKNINKAIDYLINQFEYSEQ